MDDGEISRVIEAVHRFATLVEPTDRLEVVTDDPADNRVLECAMAGGAAFVVSGDNHRLAVRTYLGSRILSPPAFVTYLDQLHASQ